MTKRHFVALANAFRMSKPNSASSNYHLYINQWEADVQEVARACKALSPQFNRERWMGYILGKNGPSGGTIKPARKVA